MGGFSRFFIYRPVFALVIAIVIVLIGLLSIPVLPVESTPDITPPTVAVTTRYPGASADVLAQTVAQPVEQEINGVEDMLYMSSKSAASGDYNLTVYFEVGTDVNMATVLTQNRVAVAEPLLPEEVKRQGVKVKKKSTKLVLAVTLYSSDGRYDDMFLSNYSTTQIKDVIARVNGVGEVQVFGAKDFGMRVWLDPALLKARSLTTNDIISALREQNVQVAAGKIGEPPTTGQQSFEYSVTTLGRLTDPEQFQNIIVKRGERGQIVRLRDVSRVELGAQTYAWYARLNNAPTSMLGIYQIPGSNALAVAAGIREAMEGLSENFPEGLEWSVPFDSTAYIEQSINEVVETLLVAIILVILTVYIFLQDWRTTLVPAVTIPMSLIGTFAVMLVTGQSINNLTLFGLILAIGIVVDDAIVVGGEHGATDGHRRPHGQGSNLQSHGGGGWRHRGHHLRAIGGVRAMSGATRTDRPHVSTLRHHYLGGHGLLLDQRADAEPSAMRPAPPTLAEAKARILQVVQSRIRDGNRAIHGGRAEPDPPGGPGFGSRVDLAWSGGIRTHYAARRFRSERGRRLLLRQCPAPCQRIARTNERSDDTGGRDCARHARGR